MHTLWSMILKILDTTKFNCFPWQDSCEMSAERDNHLPKRSLPLLVGNSPISVCTRSEAITYRWNSHHIRPNRYTLSSLTIYEPSLPEWDTRSDRTGWRLWCCRRPRCHCRVHKLVNCVLNSNSNDIITINRRTMLTVFCCFHSCTIFALPDLRLSSFCHTPRLLSFSRFSPT